MSQHCPPASMFSGLSAFPLTPMNADGVDQRSFANLVRRLAGANVDSIGALGSTGMYAYLSREERRQTATTAVREASGLPVMVGIGALRTDDVRRYADDAQKAGAAAVLLAPVSYQRLTVAEVFDLYADVVQDLSVPLCVYDNPGTTGFVFSDELHGRIAALPGVAAVKIPGPEAPDAEARIAAVRSVLRPDIALGISGDEHAAAGLNAGADVFMSVLAGLLPHPILRIVRATRRGDPDAATAASEELRPIWDLMRSWGSLRVTATAAELLGLATPPSLPRPLHGLPTDARNHLEYALREIPT